MNDGRDYCRRKTEPGKPVICWRDGVWIIGGSMGAVVGEKVDPAIEMSMGDAAAVDCGVLFWRRAHDGRERSAEQLAKVSAALARLDEEKLRTFRCWTGSDDRRRDGEFLRCWAI